MTTHVRTKQWLQLRRTWPLFIMLLPAIVYLLIFAYYPMYGAMIAFKNYTITDGILGSRWVGLDHFVQFLSSYRCGELVRNTLGVIARLIQMLGGSDRDLMGVASAVPHIYVWSGIWQHAGWSTILYLATLSSVDPELHEAAIIDGATRMRRVWNIDLPTLTPTIVICLIMDLGSLMSVGSEKMLLMQNNLNRETTQIISTYVYELGIASASPRYSYATAIGLFNTLINFVLITLVNQVCKKLNQASLW